MLLAIDIGNTTMYFSTIINNEIKSTFRIETEKNKSFDEYAVFIKEVLEKRISIKEVKGAIISSVVPEVTNKIEKAINSIFDINSIVVKRDIEADFKIKSECLRDLGSDLIADTVGAILKYKAPMIIFDMGTATTCSVINKNAEFCGGMICPGLKTGAESLIKNASQLSKFNLGKPKEVVATVTSECINSGVIYGHSEMINGIRKRVEEETHEKYTVIITGGNSDYIIEYIDKDIIQDKNLIFYGLNELYKKFITKDNKK